MMNIIRSFDSEIVYSPKTFQQCCEELNITDQNLSGDDIWNCDSEGYDQLMEMCETILYDEHKSHCDMNSTYFRMINILNSDENLTEIQKKNMIIPLILLMNRKRIGRKKTIPTPKKFMEYVYKTPKNYLLKNYSTDILDLCEFREVDNEYEIYNDSGEIDCEIRNGKDLNKNDESPKEIKKRKKRTFSDDGDKKTFNDDSWNSLICRQLIELLKMKDLSNGERKHLSVISHHIKTNTVNRMKKDPTVKLWITEKGLNTLYKNFNHRSSMNYDEMKQLMIEKKHLRLEEKKEETSSINVGKYNPQNWKKMEQLLWKQNEKRNEILKKDPTERTTEEILFLNRTKPYHPKHTYN
jgi:hypothetical protein